MLLGSWSVLLASCSDSDPGSTGQTSDSKTPKERQITLYTWDEYFSPELITQFTSETGINVDLKFYEDTEEMTAQVKVNPSEYDVIIADGRAIELLRKARVLQSIDVPNLKHVSSTFKGRPFDPENEYSVPYMWGTTLLAYRSDLIQPTSNS